MSTAGQACSLSMFETRRKGRKQLAGSVQAESRRDFETML